MTEPDSLVLKHLQAIRTELAEIRQENQESRARFSVLEEQNANVLREIAGLYAQYATVSSRIDRMQTSIGRIERRLELVDE
jgi:predicted nuclease with TOPRIM domain